MNILIRPIITERSLSDAAQGRFTFEVDITKNKVEVAKAVAAQFNVHPITVKTIIKKGTVKLNRKTRSKVKTADIKKAIVQLKAGEKIDLFEVGGTENA